MRQRYSRVLYKTASSQLTAGNNVYDVLDFRGHRRLSPKFTKTRTTTTQRELRASGASYTHKKEYAAIAENKTGGANLPNWPPQLYTLANTALGVGLREPRLANRKAKIDLQPLPPNPAYR